MAVSLSIHQQIGQIGLRITPAQFELRRTPSDIEIRQRKPSTELTYRQADLTIDYTEMRDSIDLSSDPGALSQKKADEAKQIFDSDLARTVQAGDALARLPDKVTISRMAAQAKYFDNVRGIMTDIVLGYIAPPRFRYEPGEINREYTPGEITTEATLGQTEISDFQPWSVKTYIERQPFVDIQTKGWAFDFKI